MRRNSAKPGDGLALGLPQIFQLQSLCPKPPLEQISEPATLPVNC